MEEVFKDTVRDYPQISTFNKYIDYKSINHCDRAQITGNPLIFKQVISSILLFLIELKPQKIDYTILDSGFDNNFINLELKLVAKNLTEEDYSFMSNLSNYQSTFNKYMQLYGVDIKEERGQDFYFMHIKLRCELATHGSKETPKPVSVELTIKENLSVLVVEDYEPNLTIVKVHLEKMGCKVYTSTNGREALDVFEKHDDIQVIIMDINMPIMDGWEATEKIRSLKNGIDTYIIGLTASSQDLDIRHCFESGMDDVLVKPVRKKQLHNKLCALNDLKYRTFPTVESLRPELNLSLIEGQMLFKSSINQIYKQLEVLEVLIAANDKRGIEKEVPAIIGASLNINAFYFTRLLRNLFNAYGVGDKERTLTNLIKLKETIKDVKAETPELFRD
jgi:CheY-like chemotaxis protein